MTATHAIGGNAPLPTNPASDYAMVQRAVKTLLSSAPQQTVARKIGATRQTVSHYLRDERTPSTFDLCCIARAFGYRLALLPVED